MTEKEALEIARQHGLEYEIEDCLAQGMTPEEALNDWDILPDLYDLEEQNIFVEEEINYEYYGD